MSDDDLDLPREPIRRITDPVMRFMHVEAAGGLVLLACAATALVIANTTAGDAWLGFWSTQVGLSFGEFEMVHSLKHWINDGLMVLFFFLVGLEVKRELVVGELREPRKAVLPVAAALGGMLVPALVYVTLMGDHPGARGWGIPMATDIAFVVGCMAMLGSRIPLVLRVTVLSLAIVDDIGAILVIAAVYTESLDLGMLLLGGVGILLTAACARLGVRSILVYALLGLLTWFGFHESGVHATIAGVVLGLMTPARPYLKESLAGRSLRKASDILHGGEWGSSTHRAAEVQALRRTTREILSPLEYLEATIHPWSAFFVLPLFALANAGVAISITAITDPVSTAVAAGLVIGKPAGVLLGSWLAVRFVLKQLPEGITWGSLLGAGFLTGIGFTMAMFIAGLALEEGLASAKVGILGASAVAAIVGMLILTRVLPNGQGR